VGCDLGAHRAGTHDGRDELVGRKLQAHGGDDKRGDSIRVEPVANFVARPFREFKGGTDTYPHPPPSVGDSPPGSGAGHRARF
jgi:hypothetical protein